MQLAKAHKSIIKHLTARGLKPKLAMLDNKVSEQIKTMLHEEDIDFELTPAGLHRQNMAEHAIQTFKNHFIARLCSTNAAFSLHLWDELLEQATITINLLHQSRLDPHLSAYTHAFQPFNYTRTPIAPPGIKVLVHEHATE